MEDRETWQGDPYRHYHRSNKDLAEGCHRVYPQPTPYDPEDD